MKASEFDTLVDKLARNSDGYGDVYGDDDDDGDYVNWGEVNEVFWNNKDVVADDGTVITLVEDIGGEGQGDYAALVFKVELSDGTVEYFRHEGYYASYDGTHWDEYDTEQVEPYEVTATKYRKVGTR